MGGSGVRNLERRYRTLLRVLPRWYRRDREEEMVGIFLTERDDDLDLEHSWPGWGETWAVLGLAVRTHLAAGAALTSVPAKVVWRGEVVRALGMLGLLLGLYYATSAVVQVFTLFGGPEAVPWWRVLELAPFVAFPALLSGRRTLAKVAAGAPALLSVVALGQPGPAVLMWTVFQLPSLVTFACLCLGFHREAPVPPAGRLLWWGGGAVTLGVVGGVAAGTGLLLLGLVTAGARVFAFVRGDAVFGRALSLFALLQLVPVVLLAVAWDEVVMSRAVLAVLLVLAVVLPVRRRSKAAPQVG
ncbi:hypothetical protein [Lentzea flaviverrucosa]|uniref:Uncharacterized protein n=1 Tax=Lentzea flaviverrucosa TaxID=200379 RepID=A0A1H9AFS7_9PSEU|nr:hypothetical protein [Lentzea flaviverrucosa]RDI32075.1 hypothetical protein DFR72_103476 [Lentzea flaviverrucosa]SEP75550.1 hypothetical protein SAMN05216195_101182 [Lentzea flaviverrucosa]